MIFHDLFAHIFPVHEIEQTSWFINHYELRLLLEVQKTTNNQQFVLALVINLGSFIAQISNFVVKDENYRVNVLTKSFNRFLEQMDERFEVVFENHTIKSLNQIKVKARFARC